MDARESSGGDPPRGQQPVSVHQCKHPSTGGITVFTTDGQRPPGVGVEVKIVEAKRPDSQLSTALQRGLYMRGDPGLIIDNGAQIRNAGDLKKVLSRLGRTPKLTVAGCDELHPGLDTDSWKQYCQCAGKCGNSLMSTTGQQFGGRDRAQALQEDWDNYRRANPGLEVGAPIFLMCTTCADKKVAEGTAAAAPSPLLQSPHYTQEQLDTHVATAVAAAQQATQHAAQHAAQQSAKAEKEAAVAAMVAAQAERDTAVAVAQQAGKAQQAAEAERDTAVAAAQQAAIVAAQQAEAQKNAAVATRRRTRRGGVQG